MVAGVPRSASLLFAEGLFVLSVSGMRGRWWANRGARCCWWLGEDRGGSCLGKRQWKGVKSLTGSSESESGVWEWIDSFTRPNKILHLADLIALAAQLIKLPAEMFISAPCLTSLPSDSKIFLTFLHFLAGCSLALRCFFLFSSVGTLPLREIKDLKCPCGWWNYHLHIWRPLCCGAETCSSLESTNRLQFLRSSSLYMTCWK